MTNSALERMAVYYRSGAMGLAAARRLGACLPPAARGQLGGAGGRRRPS